MIDLTLRRKALEASGWTFAQVMSDAPGGFSWRAGTDSPANGRTARTLDLLLPQLPAVEHDPGLALRLLIEYADKHDLQWDLSRCEHPGKTVCLLYAILVVRDIHEEQCNVEPATAICEAIVAAHVAIVAAAERIKNDVQ